ncbi:MAG: hypothetical protein WAM98_16925 [Terriglobales bacterium]
MTETEKHQLRGEVVRDFQEAVDNLKALIEKGKRASESLIDLATWVRRSCSTDHKFDPARDFWSKDHHANVIKNETRYREVMNYDDLITLVDHIVSVQKRVDELRERKQTLGCD